MNRSVVLFPAPRRFREENIGCDYRSAVWVCVPSSVSDALKRRVFDWASELAPLFAGPLQVTAAVPASGRVLLTIRPPAASGPTLVSQGYRLRATPRGITLDAADEAGLYYGLLTLAQVLRQRGARCPAFTVEDWPDLPRRGVMLDISRCKVPTQATLYQLIDRLARWKINEVQLYTEHTFAYSAHRTVWHDSSPMTAREILELDAYCRERFIDLVPNQNSFGHFERWLKFPEYRHLAESPDGFDYAWGGRSPCGSTLAPRRESLDFLDSLYAELLPNFGSRLFNVGCDETWELGQGWSKPLVEKRGKTRVYLDFLLQIRRRVAAHRRRMMFWGDIIIHQPALIRELKSDMVALEWGYEATHPFDRHCPLFGASGIPFYVCPGTSSWNSITGRTTNATANLVSAAQNGMQHGAIGLLVTDWGDGGHHQYLPVSYAGFAGGAAYSWGLKANGQADLAAMVSRDVFADPTGTLGRLFWEFGELRDGVGDRSSNSTIFHKALFWDLDPARLDVQGLSLRGVRRAVTRLAELEEAAADARPAAPDGELARAELLNGIALARQACRRLLFAMTGKLDRAAMAGELRAVVGRHSDLWLARNRPGGLHESSERLRKALLPLEGAGSVSSRVRK